MYPRICFYVSTWLLGYPQYGTAFLERPSTEETVQPGTYTWVVAIYHASHEFPICTGSIVDDFSVLTSCTCVTADEEHMAAFPSTEKALAVIGGNPQANSPFHESRTVLDIVVHENCEREWVGTRVDLAILKVNKSFKTRYYKFVSKMPFYQSHNVESLRQQLISFSFGISQCRVLTFGYYKKPFNESEAITFEPTHSLRVLVTNFATPHEECKHSCPNESHCEFDFYNREDMCQIGHGTGIGPCGVLPGSPVFCHKHVWGVYTGRRNCVLYPGGTAIPTVISFLDFYRANVNAVRIIRWTTSEVLIIVTTGRFLSTRFNFSE